MFKLSKRTPAQPKGTGTDKAPAVKIRNLNRSCIVVVQHGGTTDSFGGGHDINGSDVHTALILSRNPGREVFLGLSVEFPIPHVNQLDSSGVGICYSAGRSSNDTIRVAGEHRLLVKYPLDRVTTTVSSVPRDLDIDIPAELREKCSLLKIEIGNVDDIRIEGLGMPYSNSRHRCADWLRGLPVAGNLTLLDILKSPEQSFIVNHKPEPMEKELNPDVWPAPFDYPWGDTHFWDVDRFSEQAKENPGGRFLTAWTFATDNDHAAVLTQSLAQDIVWVDDAAKRLSNVRLRAYAAESRNPRAWFCLVVPCNEWFGRTFEHAWRRLIACKLSVVFFDEEGNERSTRRAEICEHPEFLSDMRDHPVSGNELVLRISPWASGDKRDDFKVKTFSDRRRALQALDQSSANWNVVSLQFDVEINDYERKCDAVNEMLPGSRPSNPSVFGLTVPGDIYAPLIGRPEALQHVAERQALARAIIRGTGFDGISLERWPGHEMSDTFPRLPVANLFRFASDTERRAVLESMLPGDRRRFEKYLSHRHLGLAIITAGPGFGKTTALAVAIYALLRSVGRVYMSAPTDIACDVATDRLVDVSKDVTRRVNSEVQPGKGGLLPLRRLLVIRGYKREDELAAFMNILQCPESINDAPKNGKHTSSWKLDNSLAFWVLTAIGSLVVPALRPDDCSRLHDAKRSFENDKKLENLLKVARMDMTWEQYVKACQVPKGRIQAMMRHILMQADVLCTTPAESTKEPCLSWKREQARGFAIDEAACMSRPDFYSVWGNTMMPCVMAGDHLQLDPNPAVRPLTDEVTDGVCQNRHEHDAKISIMEFLQASGWPVFRMLTQLRMGKGLFTLSQKVIYPDLRANYGPGCDISLPGHASGRAMEAFMLRKFSPELKPSPEGTLREVFVHCPGSRVRVNRVTKSKSSPDQVRIGLRLLDELVRTTEVDPSDIVIITLYGANVGVIEDQLKRYASLVGKITVSHVDSIQGKERPIAVVLFGTTHASGPGFTKEPRRLNVAISRHSSFLLLVGDIDAAGDFRSQGPNAHGRGGGRGRRGGHTSRGGRGQGEAREMEELWKLARERFYFENENGEPESRAAPTLRAALMLMCKAERVVTVAGGV